MPLALGCRWSSIAAINTRKTRTSLASRRERTARTGATGDVRTTVLPNSIPVEVVATIVPILTYATNHMFPRIVVKTTSNNNALLVLLALVVISCSGCHRQFYRKQADQEANALMREKSRHLNRPAQIPLGIEVDRRSRMFNPFDLDFQPMPLDDPASHRYMQCVDGRRGYPLWHAAGITNSAESPDWWEFLPLDEDGVLRLNADTAVQIALLHSPEYQEQLEQLYPVSYTHLTLPTIYSV